MMTTMMSVIRAARACRRRLRPSVGRVRRVVVGQYAYRIEVDASVVAGDRDEGGLVARPHARRLLGLISGTEPAYILQIRQ